MNEIVQEYVGLAKKWGDAMAASDSSSANRLFDRIADLYERIATEGQEGLLLKHADDESECVRFFIASHIKELDPTRAIQMYERLACSPLPFVAVSADYILRELRRVR